MPANLRPLSQREIEIVGEHAARRGQVRALEHAIADDTGGIGMPAGVRLSALDLLERRGHITPEMAAAANYFCALFQRAGLDGLRAADLARTPGGKARDVLPASNEHCRRRIGEIMQVLGGSGSTAASVIWHVAGLEWTPHRWATVTGRRQDYATGALVASLNVLSAHLGGGRRQRRS